MPEFLSRISGQLTEFWNKFTSKQKIQIVAIVITVIVALALLVVFLNKPKYVLLQGELEAKDINAITEQLTASDITNRVGEDGKSVYVEENSKTAATLALAEVGIISTGDMTYQELINNSIMTSDSDKILKYKIFFEGELARKIEILESIEDANVSLVIPENSRLVFDDAAEAKASIVVTSKETLDSKVVESIAKLVAAAVTNLELKNVTVIDSVGKLLFDGEYMTGDIGGNISGSDYELQKELIVKNNVRSILLSAGEYDDAMVTVDLVMDYDKLDTVTETHTTQDGTNTGIIDTESNYTEESVNSGSIGTPGTDANGVTDTMIADTNEATVTIEERNVVYTYDTKVATAVKAIGGIIKDESAVTVSLTKNRFYDQAILEKQVGGPLETISWEEYKYNIRNQGNIKIANIDQDIIDMVKLASNIDNVKVVAYETPRFIDKEVIESPTSDYILIGIIVVMILLLGYAVYKGTEPVEIKEIEPELSVEDMLATTKESADLESIEFDGKSDARVQIENFVDNNPDAVALLLRNWLNEDWE